MSEVSIDDLPTEIIIQIFQNLDLTHVIESCSVTCLKWQSIAAKYFLLPHFRKLAKLDQHFERTLDSNFEGFNWRCGEDFINENNENVVMKVYDKLIRYKGIIIRHA